MYLPLPFGVSVPPAMARLILSGETPLALTLTGFSKPAYSTFMRSAATVAPIGGAMTLYFCTKSRRMISPAALGIMM